MNLDKLSHEQLVSTLHTNKYEHRESFYKFLQQFFLYGIVGLLAGGFFDRVINRVEGDAPSKSKCAAFLGIQFAFVALFFYVALKLKQGIPFDDWMMGTFAGFIFSLSFFNSQQKLTDNMQCIFL